MFQRTINNVVRAKGVGLHTGHPVEMTLKPAPPHTGIVFVRTDLPERIEIPGVVESVESTLLCTTLSHEGASVNTVEHLMSALSSLGVDNLLVEVTQEEIPIMDGSAAPFIFLLQSAGIVEQKAEKLFIKVTEPMMMECGDKRIELLPYDGFRIECSVDFDHPMLGEESLAFEFSSTNMMREISRARTFGFTKDIEYLQSRGLAKGGSMKNAIIFDDNGVVNEDGLRFHDEVVRHKVLDCVGDLYLAGHAILGLCRIHKSGHELNVRMVSGMLGEFHDCWKFVTVKDDLPIHYGAAHPAAVNS